MRRQKGTKDREHGRISWFMRLTEFFSKRSTVQEELGEAKEEAAYPRENPYLHKLRGILEQIFSRYEMSYREFRPLLIDTDTPPESMLDEDQVEIVLEQISQDLNFLRIVTDRPVYFEEYIQRMYEDNGLVVQVCPRGGEYLTDVNVILDMEQKGECPLKHMREDMLYIPVYKREWCQVENMGNLDISIPIGYNTVIVKGV